MYVPYTMFLLSYQIAPKILPHIPTYHLIASMFPRSDIIYSSLRSWSTSDCRELISFVNKISFRTSPGPRTKSIIFGRTDAATSRTPRTPKMILEANMKFQEV